MVHAGRAGCIPHLMRLLLVLVLLRAAGYR